MRALPVILAHPDGRRRPHSLRPGILRSGFMPVTGSSLDAELGKRRSGRRREVATRTFLQRPPACAFRAYKHGGVFEPVWASLSLFGPVARSKYRILRTRPLGF